MLFIRIFGVGLIVLLKLFIETEFSFVFRSPVESTFFIDPGTAGLWDRSPTINWRKPFSLLKPLNGAGHMVLLESVIMGLGKGP